MGYVKRAFALSGLPW